MRRPHGQRTLQQLWRLVLQRVLLLHQKLQEEEAKQTSLLARSLHAPCRATTDCSVVCLSREVVVQPKSLC